MKKNGVVYTPENIVNLLLKEVDYNGKKILKKHVMENSCGDGAFLIKIVEKYCEEFLLTNSDIDKLVLELEKYIHGLEIDKIEVEKTKKNLDNIISKFTPKKVKWDINQGNSLLIKKYDNKMDYVIGNPPYIRIHDLNEDNIAIKKLNFSKFGMTDLFIAFFEIGINMLSKNGKLVYITPNSFFTSKAGSEFRNYIIEKKILTKILNLKHYKAFKNITTYTTITVLDKKNKNNFLQYNEYQNEKNLILNYDDIFINDCYYFAEKETLKDLKNILNYKESSKKNLLDVKNGFATLADSIFISDDFLFKSKYIYKAIKASTNQIKKIIFPYDSSFNLVDFNLFEKDLQKYLENNKKLLENRSLEKNSKWYEFGRSQGIRDFFKKKIVINNLISESNKLKLAYIDSKIGVYSGLYIITNFDDNLKLIEKFLLSSDFLDYVSVLGKYKNGGYYTFSSSDVKKYLIYKLNKFYEGVKENE